ncbi:MAG: hypothetical protein ABFD57_01740 [Smithella sp.]
MVTIKFTEEEAAESRELLKAVIKPLERSIAATDLGHREFRAFLKKRRTLVDELLKHLETMLSFELTEDDAQEGVAMLKDAIPVLDRSIAATDLAHRDYREFLKKRRALVDELIKRLEK